MISTLSRVLLVLAAAVLCALAIGACGDDSEKQASSAKQVLEETFKATSTSLRSGRLDARLQLEPEGLLALGGPISLDVKGPFVVPDNEGQPLADLSAVVTLAGQRYDGGLISDGRRAFLKLDGKAYRLDAQQRSGSGRQLKSFAFEPLGAIEGEQTKGNARIGGLDTVRVTGKVDPQRLLAGLDGLVDAKMGKQIADAVKSADFELWSGAEDKIVRQFVLRLGFEFAAGSKPPISGLEAGRIELRVRLDDVNGKPADLKAPKNALPLSKVPTDRGLGGLVECVSNAGGSGTGIAQCVSALKP